MYIFATLIDRHPFRHLLLPRDLRESLLVSECIFEARAPGGTRDETRTGLTRLVYARVPGPDVEYLSTAASPKNDADNSALSSTGSCNMVTRGRIKSGHVLPAQAKGAGGASRRRQAFVCLGETFRKIGR